MVKSRRVLRTGMVAMLVVLALSTVATAQATGYWPSSGSPHTFSYDGCTNAKAMLTVTTTYALGYTQDQGACATRQDVTACARLSGGVPTCDYDITTSSTSTAQAFLASNYAGTSNHRIEVGTNDWSSYVNSDFTLAN